MVPVSNVSELTGINALQDEIIRIAGDRELFPSVGRDLPEEWVKIEVALRKSRENDQVQILIFPLLKIMIQCRLEQPVTVNPFITPSK